MSVISARYILSIASKTKFYVYAQKDQCHFDSNFIAMADVFNSFHLFFFNCVSAERFSLEYILKHKMKEHRPHSTLRAFKSMNMHREYDIDDTFETYQ